MQLIDAWPYSRTWAELEEGTEMPSPHAFSKVQSQPQQRGAIEDVCSSWPAQLSGHAPSPLSGFLICLQTTYLVQKARLPAFPCAQPVLAALGEVVLFLTRRSQVHNAAGC